MKMLNKKGKGKRLTMKTVYVYAPALYKTGGTELAHQLVKQLNDFCVPSKIAYVGIKESENPINEAFKIYVDDYVNADNVPDTLDTVIVFPEIYTEYLAKYKFAKKIIWWMSVDNFTRDNSFSGAVKYYGILRGIIRYFAGQIKNKTSTLQLADYHAYQSEYAKNYLVSLGFKNILPLSDFINESYFCGDNNTTREDIVLYNPKKGFSFTKRIISAFPSYKWIALENLTNAEVSKLLRRSKVYIDFGNHPGKDRFPREAAISGCCVITGKKGAAQNDYDISIPNEYKFNDSIFSIKSIGEMIQKCLDNYELTSKDFEQYREKIKQEKEKFKEDTKNLINQLEIYNGEQEDC